MKRPEAVFWHLFCGTEKVATLSCSLVRFCLFLLEKETEMNEKEIKFKNMTKVKNFLKSYSCKVTHAHELKKEKFKVLKKT